MLALAAANAVGVVLFGTLYAIAGARVLSQVGFLGCLAVLFALMTTVWIRTEARHGGVAPLRRIVRIVGGLLCVVVATPAVVLTPVFWLDAQLPVEAGLHAVRGGVMALILVTLVLVVLVNVTGSVVVAGRAVLAGRHSGRGA